MFRLLRATMSFVPPEAELDEVARSAHPVPETESTEPAGKYTSAEPAVCGDPVFLSLTSVLAPPLAFAQSVAGSTVKV
jgi:hypothetical protein